MTTETPRAIVYARTSTDDKGQRPERQIKDAEKWCTLHGVDLVGSVVDEGTSATKVQAFQRPRFLEACDLAKEHGAVLLFEKADRLTRMGTKDFFWTLAELEARYGVAAWFMSLGGPERQEEDIASAILSTADVQAGSDWAKAHGVRVASGMAASPNRPGRPKKYLSAEELALAKRLKDEGLGLRRIAHELSKKRGAFDVADASARARRTVGKTLVEDYLKGRRTDVQEVAA